MELIDFFEWYDEEEAILYYLFMMADGEISSEEEELFYALCEELEMKDYKRKYKKLKRYVENYDLQFEDEDYYEDEEDEAYDKEKPILSIIKRELSFSNYLESSDYAKIIWNLISLGYSDGNYSEKEKEIVQYFVNQFEIEDAIYRELIDIAETIQSVENRYQWSLSESNQSKKASETLRDVELNKLMNDFNLVLEELYV